MVDSMDVAILVTLAATHVETDGAVEAEVAEEEELAGLMDAAVDALTLATHVDITSAKKNIAMKDVLQTKSQKRSRST